MPLTRFDELTCHQTVSTFDHPETSDRAWTEKIWCNVHDTKGRIVLATGFGVYPNRNVMDGYACVNVDNRRQHNLRVSRELRPRIDEVAVGPIRYEVTEPFRRIRVACGENTHDLSFELDFLGRFQPAEEEPQHKRSHGRVCVNTCRYAQLGRARGWIKVAGERYTVDEETFCAARDHSWGVRMGVGAPEQGVQAQDVADFTGMMINWIALQLPDKAITLYLIERADGHVERLTGHVVGPEADRPAVPIIAVDHDYKFHEHSARMRSGRLVLRCADGASYTIETRELTTMYLRGGGYLGCKGVTHGLWMGPEWEDGEVWEVADRKVADQAHGLDDTVVEVRCGDEAGWGIVENLVLPPFPRYGFELPRARR